MNFRLAYLGVLGKVDLCFLLMTQRNTNQFTKIKIHAEFSNLPTIFFQGPKAIGE